MGKTIQTISLICTNRLKPSASGAAAASGVGPLGLPVGTQLKATLVVRRAHLPSFCLLTVVPRLHTPFTPLRLPSVIEGR